MNQTNQIDATITIIGSGPVGMVAALALQSRGISVILLEKGPDVLRSEWRGSTLHPPTVEILDELGLAADILKNAVRLERLTYRDLEIDGEASFDYSLLGGLTRFPFRMQYEQYKLVRLLKKALVERDITTLYEHEVVQMRQNHNLVELEVDTPDGRQFFRSRWSVGADGAHSTVRKLMGIPFPGFTYPFQSLVAATNFPFQDHLPDLPPVSYWTGPRGRFSLIRTPDIWRIALSTDTTSDEVYEYDPSGDPHSDFLMDIDLLFGGEVDPLSINLQQHQMYRTHQRLAATFKSGLVLLAGDAAHLSSTTGGMGLNSGIHDAWALAHAFDQGDKEDALAAYAGGRRQVAEEFIQPQTTSNRQATDLASFEARTVRLTKIVELAADEETARDHLIGTSMLRVAGIGPAALHS